MFELLENSIEYGCPLSPMALSVMDYQILRMKKPRSCRYARVMRIAVEKCNTPRFRQFQIVQILHTPNVMEIGLIRIGELKKLRIVLIRDQATLAWKTRPVQHGSGIVPASNFQDRSNRHGKQFQKYR
jgi:hypothetical protein